MRAGFERRFAWLLVALTAACAPRGAPEEPAPEERAAVETMAERPAVEPVPVPPAFEAAVEAGTRTLEGVPGPRYWQQRVDYRISAALDPETARLQGEEWITYHNRSPDTLGVMIFHLYQNLFQEGQPRNRPVPITGGMTVERLTVEGQEAVRLEGAQRPPRTGAVYQEQGTIMALRLPRPLPPNDSVQLEVAWSFTVPPTGAPRTGHIDNTVFNVAQWYPQVATYDDVEGWHTDPYLANGEFYLEYGDFDVSITVPEGWLVSSTGELQNADEVLPAPVQDRLARARTQDDVVSVVSEREFGPGTATRQSPGGRLTWRFRAEDVRDVAFATSNRYLWDATRALVPGAGGGTDTVAVHAFYRPEAETWREAARYTRHATEFHAERWHPYMYPKIASAEGPIGGMEYPMLVFVQSFRERPRVLYTVINHEVAHQWFPMMVGSNETAFAWMDEGLGTYIENLATIDFFEDATPFADEMPQYLRIAGTGLEEPIMRHSDRFGPGPARVIASYRKPALMLNALGGVVGEETVNEALAEYADRWLFRHPYPLDFFNTVEDVAGRDLDWFWHPFWYETATMDQAIAAVDPTDGGERVRVTIEDQGEAPMPVHLMLVTETGEQRRVTVPVDVWLRGARRHTETVELPAPVSRVVIDPEEIFPDVDRQDNVWERAGPNGG